MREFKGGNITAKSLNSKANPELLKYLKQNPEELKTESEIIDLFSDAVNAWNDRGERRNAYGEWEGESKMSRYMHAHADRVELNYFEKISLFMGELAHPYTYKQQGISITLGKKNRKYIVPDIDGIADFEFNRLHLGEEFNVRINPLSPDFITLYQGDKLIATAHEKDKYAACVADLKYIPDSASKHKQFIAKLEAYGYDHAMKEMDRQREILRQHGLSATGTDGLGWYDTPKSVFNHVQNQIEDIRNGVIDQSGDSKRTALMNM